MTLLPDRSTLLLPFREGASNGAQALRPVVEVPHSRIKEHIANFLRLDEDLSGDALDETYVSFLETQNNIFPEIDFRVYC